MTTTETKKDEYAEFLESKKLLAVPTGIENPGPINPRMFPFQRDIVRWALRRGRAALFKSPGLGKSFDQLEWAQHVCEHTGGPCLILAPLIVSRQTKREGIKFDIKGDVRVVSNQAECGLGINISNYEKFLSGRFDPEAFTSVVLDESSVLKDFSAVTTKELIDAFKETAFKLCCTATPAPNDYMELGNHAEFLGVMTRSEMLSMFFTHDGGDTSKWRVKGHAQEEFWKWVCSWAVNIRKPSDLGYSDEGFELPPLIIHEHVVPCDIKQAGLLFPMPAHTMDERRGARRGSIDNRVAKAVEIANATKESCAVFCDLNAESEAATEAIEGAVEVTGSDSEEHKEKTMLDFAEGTLGTVVSKASIVGFGLNLQVCSKVIALGLSDSFEAYFQFVRRFWRFGQTKPVHVHIIVSDLENAVVSNIKRKEADADKMAEEMVKFMAPISSEEIRGVVRDKTEYKRRTEECERGQWKMELGDCVEVAKTIPDNSIHYSIWSPPFESLYTYSNSDRDMGNCKDSAQFSLHFAFLIEELQRIMIPGRLVSFHCMNLPISKQRDGYIGIRDFRGELIRAFVKAGFIFHSEVCIWKDPVTAMHRTKAIGLLHKQIKKDSCMSRQGIPDYLVTMRKPGVNPEPVDGIFPEYIGEKDPKTLAPIRDYATGGFTGEYYKPGSEGYSIGVWQNYASPVWMDINPSDTLQRESAREEKDERHVCPLQKQVIQRGLELWSNPGDTVLSPFAGIGSEGYVALQMGRKFIGIELKESYFKQACLNLKAAERPAEMELPLMA